MSFASALRPLAASPLALAWWAAVRLKLQYGWRWPATTPQTVLLVSWDFPPNASTGAHLPASFARAAAQADWRVAVVCGPGPAAVSDGGRELAASVPPGVSIHRVPRVLSSERHMRLHPAAFVPDIDGGYLSALALASTAFNALANAPPSVVFASGPRFANFLAARWLADAFGAQLVLQYRDEWTVNTPAFVHVTDNDRIEERRCLERAGLVSFVSDGKREAYEKAFPEIDATKFVTTPNGWEPYFQALARMGTAHLPKRPGVFTLSYTGRCHISLKPLLDLCAQLLQRRPDLAARFRLVFVGDQIAENRRLMADFAGRFPEALLTLPAVTPAAAIEIQRESSALLLINDYMYGGIVPLKTFEYLCSARPVLVYGRTGGGAEIVEKLGAGISFAADDADGFETAITAMISRPAGWDTAARRTWCERNNRKVLVEEMLAAISKLPDGAPARRRRRGQPKSIDQAELREAGLTL